MSDIRTIVLTASIANFVIGMGAFLPVGLVEPIAADLQISAVRAGQLLTVYALAYAIGSPLLVAATGRLGRRRVMMWSFAIFCGSAALSALATNESTLIVARLVAAIGAGVFSPVAAAVVAGLSPEEQRGKMLAAAFFGLTLAQVLGVPTGSWVGYTFGWRWAFWIVVALGVPIFFLIAIRVPRGLRFQPVSLSDLRGVLADARMMLAVAFTALFLGGIYVVYTYVAPLMSAAMGFDGNRISALLLIYGFGAVFGNLLGGWLTDRFGPERTLAGLAVAQVLLMPLYALLPMPVWVVFALSLVWSICGWSFMAAQQTRLVMRGPERAPVTLSLNAAAIYVGAAVGSAIGGAILAGLGPLWLGPVGAVVIVTALMSLRMAR